MKDKLLQMRVDEEFLSKLEYLQKINGYKNKSETVRKILEKESRKESYDITSEREKTIRKEFAERIYGKFNNDATVGIVLKNIILDVLQEY